MEDPQKMEQIDRFIQSEWPSVLDDIRSLVRIESVEELEKTREGEPFGPGPRAALDKALGIASDMGLKTKNVDGYIGIADYPGESDSQIAMIGHLDTVPAGVGWNYEPYDLTVRNGYLIGRGVADDKGPTVVAMHALRFWAENGAKFPKTVRMLFGTNEETGMGDVEYYQDRYADPDFLFTPDAEFPVCYGEKGIVNLLVKSGRVEAPRIVHITGGTAVNAVPAFASVIILANPNSCDLSPYEHNGYSVKSKILWEGSDGYAGLSSEVLDSINVMQSTPGDPGLVAVRIDAEGKAAHAASPEFGVNALGLLVDYMLTRKLCAKSERPFLEFAKKCIEHTDGSRIGIAARDDDFGSLTVACGIMTADRGEISMMLDSRFPTTTDAMSIGAKVKGALSSCGVKGGSVSIEMSKPPFLLDKDSNAVKALLSAYNEATGENAKPFTMGGGTYARHFACAASFGPEKPWVKRPDWVGFMHGPDEGISEELLKQALKIYILTIDKLMNA